MNERDLAESFGQRIRTALVVSGVTPMDLARELGVSRMAVNKWEHGDAFPASSKLVRIAQITGASLEWLMYPYPIDIRSTPYAPDGEHIKHIIRATIEQMQPGGE